MNLKGSFWVICDWFRLTNDEWRNKKSPVQNKKLKPNRDLYSMFNKMARATKEKKIMAKQTNGADEDIITIVD